MAIAVKKENSARLIFTHKAARENILTAKITQTTVTASINNTVVDPITLSCSHVNCILPNMGIGTLTPSK